MVLGGELGGLPLLHTNPCQLHVSCACCSAWEGFTLLRYFHSFGVMHLLLASAFCCCSLSFRLPFDLCCLNPHCMSYTLHSIIFWEVFFLSIYPPVEWECYGLRPHLQYCIVAPYLLLKVAAFYAVSLFTVSYVYILPVASHDHDPVQSSIFAYCTFSVTRKVF